MQSSKFVLFNAPLPQVVWGFFLLGLVACGPDYVYQEAFELPQGRWPAEQAVRFEVPIEDTTARYNLYIKVANSNFYPYSNLWLFTKTIAPTAFSQIDTVELLLADEAGKWLGQQNDEQWAGYFPFKMGIGFPRKGVYQFQLLQGMRTEVLEDIGEVGLAVEKIK